LRSWPPATIDPDERRVLLGILRAVEGQNGHAIYHSRDGAAALSNPDLAPTLEFEF
jgi:hypothetical protein